MANFTVVRNKVGVNRRRYACEKDNGGVAFRQYSEMNHSGSNALVFKSVRSALKFIDKKSLTNDGYYVYDVYPYDLFIGNAVGSARKRINHA